jgi:hypothetical protein
VPTSTRLVGGQPAGARLLGPVGLRAQAERQQVTEVLLLLRPGHPGETVADGGPGVVQPALPDGQLRAAFGVEKDELWGAVPLQDPLDLVQQAGRRRLVATADVELHPPQPRVHRADAGHLANGQRPPAVPVSLVPAAEPDAEVGGEPTDEGAVAALDAEWRQCLDARDRLGERGVQLAARVEELWQEDVHQGDQVGVAEFGGDLAGLTEPRQPSFRVAERIYAAGERDQRAPLLAAGAGLPCSAERGLGGGQ